jgi:hypothetical protein
MAEELTLEHLKTMAERRGLRLPEDDLQRLLPGVVRARRQAAELREIVAAKMSRRRLRPMRHSKNSDYERKELMI